MAPLLPFVQFEFTHAIGPGEGRYVVAAPDGGRRPAPAADRTGDPVDNVTGVRLARGAADVLVIAVSSAPVAKLRIRRAARPADPGGPAEVPLLLAAFVRASAPVSSERAAAAALEALARSEAEQDAFVGEGLAVLNTAIRAYRSGTRDPYITEVTVRDPRRMRIGYGTDTDVAAGRWRLALELPPPRAERVSRGERLRPSEATATVLSGRGGVMESEELLMRVLLDLDHGRSRAAACGLAAGLRLLEAELGELADELTAAACTEAETLAATARERPLAEAEVVQVDELLAGAERLIDRWRYGTSAAEART